MEEKKSWSKKKKIITSIIGAIVIILLAGGITTWIFLEKNNGNKTIKAGEETSGGESTSIESPTGEESDTESPTQVKFTSSAVNQFSTSAGAEQDSFFSNSVFVGDSVMYGFERYIKGRQGTLGDPIFLTAGSFAARIELTEPTEDSPHPLYMGNKMQVCNALPLIGADKVFLFFGLNDIGMLGVDQTIANYQTVINNIRANSPTIQIYIISTTYMAAGSELTKLNNTNIRLLNDGLQANASAWGVGFVDVAKYMYDSSGCLVESYSSDGYVHITESAYDLWVGVLRDFASKN